MTSPARRHAGACALGGVAVLLVFGWILVAAPGGLLDETAYGLGGFYDEQARAWFQGRWDADADAFFIERFTIDDRYYMYFGPWPALLRVPVLAVTDSLDGRLTRFSLVLGLVVLLTGVSRLIWQVRGLRSPQAPGDDGPSAPSRAERAAVAAFVLAVGCGTSVVVLSASVWVYDEAILWGAAWATWTLSVGVSYLLGPSTRTLVLASALATIAVLTRVSSGVVGISLLAMVAVLELLGSRAHATIRGAGSCLARVLGLDGRLEGRRPWPAALAASVPLLAYAAVNRAKFGTLVSVPFHRQDLVNDLVPVRRGALAANGDDLVSLDQLPTNVFHYLRPDGISFHGLFPFVDFGDGVRLIGSPARDVEWGSASLTVTATYLLLLAAVGAAVVCLPRLASRSDVREARVLRVPALAAAASAVPTLVFPAVHQRYTVDFTPALVLLGATGLYALAGLLRGRRLLRRTIVVAASSLLAWNVAVNVALTFNLQRSSVFTAADDRAEYLLDRIRWTERLGIEPSLPVVRWDPTRDPMPPAARVSSILIAGDCTEVLLSDGVGWLSLALDDPRRICDAVG
jgi:hypothetical protein